MINIFSDSNLSLEDIKIKYFFVGCNIIDCNELLNNKVLKLNKNYKTGISMLMASQIGVVASSDIEKVNYYVVLSENKNFDIVLSYYADLGYKIEQVYSIEELERYITGILLCGVYDNELLVSVVNSMVYTELKALYYVSDINDGFIKLLEVILSTKGYNLQMISYIIKLIYKSEHKCKEIIKYRMNEMRENFEKLYNNTEGEN